MDDLTLDELYVPLSYLNIPRQDDLSTTTATPSKNSNNDEVHLSDEELSARFFALGDIEGNGSAYIEDWFSGHGPLPETAVRIEMTIGIESLGFSVVLADAAAWEVAGVGVRQESFSSFGFRGTVAELLEKSAQSVEQMRESYPPHVQPQFDAFLQRVDQLLVGEISRSESPSCELLVMDPSGLSCIFDPSGDRVVDSELVRMERIPRTWEDIHLLGLGERELTAVPPDMQNCSPKAMAELIRCSDRVVALTGAGISVESGIPPFRVPDAEKQTDSIWGTFDPSKMTVQAFNDRTDSSGAKAWWKMKHSIIPRIMQASPNPAHHFFGVLHRLGKLRSVVTQNIDSLHQRAGVPSEKVVELHGNMRGMICSDNVTPLNPLPYGKGACDYTCSPEEAARCNYHSGSDLPLCPKCGSPLRTETAFFGQPLPEGELVRASSAISDADLLIVIGSTLIVKPANEIPAKALLAGIPVVIVNLDATQYDRFCTKVIRRPAGEFFEDVMRLL